MNKSVKLTLCELKDATIDIGFVGENLYRTLEIDCAEAYAEYPHAAASMTVQPPQEEAYPAVVERVGNSVVWTLTDSDLAQEGDGEFQLAFTSDEVVRRTWIGTFKIHRSIMPTGNAPSGIDDFLTRAGAALTAIPETIDEALEEAKESGEFDGYSPTVEVTDITGGHRVSITDVNGTTTVDVINGTDGEDGYSPTVTVTDIEGGHRVSITDVNGTTTVDVMNGTDGEDGYSPTVTVTDIEGGHRVSITDATGTTTFDVMNGATGATPNITIGTVTTGAAGSDAAATMTGTPENPVLNLTIPRGDPGEVTEEELQAVDEAKADVIREIIDTPADVMSFADGGAGFPLTMQFRLEPIQSGTGDPAPDNVRPITGHTSFTRNRTGKNLFDKDDVTTGYYYDASGVMRSVANGSISGYIRVKAGQTYRINKYFTSNVDRYAKCYDINKNAIGVTFKPTYTGGVFTIPEGCAYVRFSTHTELNSSIMITVGSGQQGDYEPYYGVSKPTTIPTPPGTVYGGTVTDNGDGTGTLVVTRICKNMGSLTWENNASYTHTFNGILSMEDYAPVISNNTDFICTQYKAYTSSAVGAADYGIAIANNGQTIYVRDIRYSDKDVFKAAMDGVYIVYELKTKQEYTLSMDVITSLLGQNNILVDNGTMESVEYGADTKLYVNKKIKASQSLMELIVTANHEDEMKATKAYSSGDLMIVNATLYKATTSIANGATLTVGTNVSATTVAAEIAALS